jgi:mono/diheme cytochrome c family protein
MSTKKFITFTILSIAFLLTGCMSLAEDVTPPPGAQAPVLSENAPEPAPTTNTPMGPQFPENLPDPNLGMLTYLESCAPCHGETGMGDGSQAGMLENPVPALGDPALARSVTPSDWYIMVTQGNMRNFMPPFSSLTDQQRWDVVAYALSLSVSSDDLERGEVLYRENYAECLGDTGIAGELDFSDSVVMSQLSADAILTALGESQCETTSIDELTAADRWALGGYLRSLSAEPFLGLEIAEIPTEAAAPKDSDNQPETEGEIVSQTPGVGDISINLSVPEGIDTPQNLEIILRGYEGMTEVYSQTQTLTDGTATTFAAVPLPVSRFYFATIEYDNASYGSEVVEVKPDSTDLNLTVEYYPPTTDLGILSVDRLHIFLDFIDDQTLEVFQLYIFSNPGNQVLIPTEGAATAIEFIIPAAANNLSVEENMSMAFRKTETGFGIANVYPAENPYQVVFSYQVPYPERKLELAVPIGMDANALIVMAPAGGFKVKSDQLTAGGAQDFNGVTYNMFNGSNLQTGLPLEITLSGRPKADTNFFATSDEGSNNSLVIGLAGFGVMLIGAGIYLWRRNAADDDLYEDDFDEIYADEPDIEPETSDDIMDAIIALDDQYKQGGLPESAYQTRRAELKEKLRDLIG